MLIFIKKDEKYQYIYKLDTQTWHKGAYGTNLVSPINSYPECLVQAVNYGQYIVPNPPDVNFSEEWAEQAMSNVRDGWPVGRTVPDIFTPTNFYKFMIGELGAVEVIGDAESLLEAFTREGCYCKLNTMSSQIYSLSTVLDAAESKTPTRGVIATRPFDLGEPDVFKTITDVRIRGQFPKGAVKFILLGSNDGINFTTISTLRGRSWKLFRMIILADLGPTDRISWVDIMYDTKFTNKLR